MDMELATKTIRVLSQTLDDLRRENEKMKSDLVWYRADYQKTVKFMKIINQHRSELADKLKQLDETMLAYQNQENL